MKISYLDLSNKYDVLHQVVRKTFEEASKQTENTLLGQLNELIKRDLLVIEETEPLLIRSFHSQDTPSVEIRMERGIRLVLKNQEYVEALEKQNESLKEQLSALELRLSKVRDTFIGCEF